MYAPRQDPRRTGQRRILLAVVLLAALGFVGCTTVHSAAAPPTGSVATPMPARESELEAGTYLVTNFGVPFEITVPGGYDYTPEGGLLRGSEAFVRFDAPAFVSADACHWTTPLTKVVGPSVQDLAEALSAVASTTTTTPVDIRVDGYRGVEFDLFVKEGIDIDDCRASRMCIHSEVQHDCWRYHHEGRDQRETLRILDLDGQRVVLTVGQWEQDVDPAALAEAREIFDSITFLTKGSVAKPTAVPLPRSGELTPGTYLVTSLAVPFEITVGEGWTSLGGWALIDGIPGRAGSFLTFLAPSFVPADACTWRGTLGEADTSVEGFVDALTSQASTATTSPLPITAGTFRGLEFSLHVENDVLLNGCTDTRMCIHSKWWSYCTRWYSEPSEREVYRVIDLDGTRAVITVGEFAPVDDAEREAAMAVFDSMSFVTD